MKWTLTDIQKETDHPFLNFYVVNYDVNVGDCVKKYYYFVTSRTTTSSSLRVVNPKRRADAVMIGTYMIKDNQLYLLLEKQFRPALNREVISFPGGLMDETDEDEIQTAKREVEEETGYQIADAEVLIPPSPTSEGLSDECNAVVLARIVSKGFEHKEEFEDISAKLYSAKEVKELLADKNNMFSNPGRLLILYLLEKYKEI